MSLNQTKVERSEAQLKKPGRSGSAGHQRGPNVPGKGGGAGGTAPPGSNPASTIRGGKRPNGPWAQSRGNSSAGNSEPDATHKVQNGGHVQRQQDGPPLSGIVDNGVLFSRQSSRSVPAGTSDAKSSVATKQPNASVSKSSRALPRPPSSQPFIPGTSEPVSPAPTTAAPGEGSRAALQHPFSFQFGSISPGFINGMQIPARTSSAPPNLDEQKREQTRFEATNAANKVSMISSGLHEQQRKDQVVSTQVAVVLDSQPTVKGKRNFQVPSGILPVAQAQKPPVLPGVGNSPPIQFQQSQAPVQMQYSVPSSQIQSQAVAPGPMPLPLQLQMATAQAQVQQQFVQQNLQTHALQSQGLIHQGQGLNFSQNSQINHQIGPQLGAPQPLISMGPQYVSQPASQYVPQRINKAVKITHPETHEELRFDKKSDSPGPNPLPGRLSANGLPQSRPPAPFSATHTMNFYTTLQTGSYNHTSTYYQPPKTSGVPSSSAPSVRYNFLHSSAGQSIPFMSQSGVNVLPVGKPGSVGVTLSEHVSSGSMGHDGHAPLASMSTAVVQTQVPPHAAVPIASQRHGSSASLSVQIGETQVPPHAALPVASQRHGSSASLSVQIGDAHPPVSRDEPSLNALSDSIKLVGQSAEGCLAPQKSTVEETSILTSSAAKDVQVPDQSSSQASSMTVSVAVADGISGSQSSASISEVSASKTYSVVAKQSAQEIPAVAPSKPSASISSASPISTPEAGPSISSETKRKDSAKRADHSSRQQSGKVKKEQRLQRQQQPQQQVLPSVPQQVTSSSLISKSEAEVKGGGGLETPTFDIACSEAEAAFSGQAASSKLPSQKSHQRTISGSLKASSTSVKSDEVHATLEATSELPRNSNFGIQLPSQQLDSNSVILFRPLSDSLESDEKLEANADVNQHSILGISASEASVVESEFANGVRGKDTDAVLHAPNFRGIAEVRETSGGSVSRLSNVGLDPRLRDTKIESFEASKKTDLARLDESSEEHVLVVETNVPCDRLSILADSLSSNMNTETSADLVDSDTIISKEQITSGDLKKKPIEMSCAVSDSQQESFAVDTLDYDKDSISEFEGNLLPRAAELLTSADEVCDKGLSSVAVVSPELSCAFEDKREDVSGSGFEPEKGEITKIEVVSAQKEVRRCTSNGICEDITVSYHQLSLSSESAAKKPDVQDIGAEKSGVPSIISSASKEKHSEEHNKQKSVGKRKKKKEILIKADAAGTTADLYNAYKTLEEKREEVPSPEVFEVVPSVDEKDSVKEHEKQGKNELDDWEDAAEMPSPIIKAIESDGQISTTAKQIDASKAKSLGDKKYTRDFLLTFRDQLKDLPPHFEIRADIAEQVLNPQAIASHLGDREAFPNPGRPLDWQSSGGSRLERRGSNVADEDRWTKSAGFLPGRELRMEVGFGGPPGGFRPGQGISPGILRNVRGSPMPSMGGILTGGPMTQMPVPQGGLQRNNSDADRWQRATGFQKGLIPSPQNPLPTIHKAENRYEVGKISDEEQTKQRQLKAILNKLTPQNFDKLFVQVKEVNIDSAHTLTGVISQIFDKALTEPTFCEMYAKFCVHLADELPEFNEDDEKITFRRVLLNKCQEEFERGEREQAEADRPEEDGEVKLSEEEREQRKAKARRRMLGNIRFIGELYKKSMLTERIMHECIKKLLGEFDNPDEEDLEALCKLMSTIGHMIDHSKAKEHIDAYFGRMTMLSSNQKLSSRLRFMLKDVIDLRKNGWQQRRKVEGPKKIEEVHRDAVQERQAQGGRLTRGPSMGSSGRRLPQPTDYGLRGAASQVYSSGAPMGSLQQSGGGMRGSQPQIGLRAFGGQDVRLEDRPLPVPLSQRLPDEAPLTLGPQGGLGRGMSVRGQPLAPGRSALADVPSIVHGDNRRMGLGPLAGYNPHSGSDRMPFGGREEILSRNAGAERPSNLMEKPLLEKPFIQERNISGAVARDFRSSDRSFEKAGIPTNLGSRGPSPGLPLPLLERTQSSEEHLRKMSTMAIKEFYSVRDMKEAALCVDELKAPVFYPTMVSLWVTDSFDRKDIERDLLPKLLIYLYKDEPYLLKHEQLLKGFELVLSSLEDTVVDAPKAPEFLGGILAKIVLADIFSIGDVARLIKDGGLEPGSSLEMGLALDVLGSLLEIIKREKGELVLSDMYRTSGVRLEDFMSFDLKKPGKFDSFLEKKNIQCLYPLMPVENHIREFLIHDEPMKEILKWVELD
eukprot:Gb_05240 [translate_table: standard]